MPAQGNEAEPFINEMNKNDKKNVKGYTLVEILVVMAIIALAVSLIGPAISRGMRGTQVKAVVRHTASALRYARSMAITYRAVIEVAFNMEESQYTVRVLHRAERPSFDGALNQDPAEEEPAYEESYQGEESGAPSGEIYEIEDPVVLLGLSFGDSRMIDYGEASIIFFPKGNSTGGTIYIGKSETSYYALSVNPITGLVEVEASE